MGAFFFDYIWPVLLIFAFEVCGELPNLFFRLNSDLLCEFKVCKGGVANVSEFKGLVIYNYA